MAMSKGWMHLTISPGSPTMVTSSFCPTRPCEQTVNSQSQGRAALTASALPERCSSALTLAGTKAGVYFYPRPQRLKGVTMLLFLLRLPPTHLFNKLF